MGVKETLDEALRDFRAEHRDSPNWRPNRILLSPSAFDQYKKELGHNEDENVVLTLEKVSVIRNEGQAEPIILEKRNFHD